MGYRLGVDIGTTFTAAAVDLDGSVEVLDLGTRGPEMPSVVYLRPDGAFLTGDAAERRSTHEPERVSRHFKRRLGDAAPVILAGSPFGADQLVSEIGRSVLEHATKRYGAAPEQVSFTHPANWGAYQRELFHEACRRTGVSSPVLLTEPEAAARWYARQERMANGERVAVYDLGGGTFDACLLTKRDHGFESVGVPEGVERLGGIDFDQAILDYVAGFVTAHLQGLDPQDPAVQTALARLRAECTAAKEALSIDTDVSIPVSLPGLATEVRLTRGEFEAMLRPTLQLTVDGVHRLLASAAMTPADIDRVLLVGGSTRIPLVSQLLEAELGRPVSADAHPKETIARGATLAPALAAAADHGVVLAPPDAPLSPPAPVVAVLANPAAAAPPPRTVPTGVLPVPAPQGSGPRSSTVVVVAAIVVAVVAIAGIVFLTLGGGGDKEQASDDTVIERTDTEESVDPTAAVSTLPTTTTTTAPATVQSPTAASASCTAPNGIEADSSPVDYDATNVLDGRVDTTWRCPGAALGETVTINLAGPTDVTSVGLLPGYAKVDPSDGTDRFPENRRVVAVRYHFDDDTTAEQSFDDVATVQSIPVSARTSTIVIEIVATSEPGGRDFTPISEVEVVGRR